MASSKRYLFWLAICFAATLLPILSLNLLLAQHSLDGNSQALAAADWQNDRHGITFIPVGTGIAQLKTIRLYDSLDIINGVVLGSSTSMSISANQFPSPIRIYNYAKTANPLLSTIGEAEYLVANINQIRWLIIPLDWSIDSLIGTLYQPGTPPLVDIPNPRANNPKAGNFVEPWYAQMLDALSYPRIESLYRIIKDILGATDRASAFRQYFLQAASDEYRCPDGVPAKDFNTQLRGQCAGLRYDGSFNYSGAYGSVLNPQFQIFSALTAGSIYSKSLLKSGGIPNEFSLQHVASMARKAQAKGGGIILFMPPLLPGMEAEFLKKPQYGEALRQTKGVLRSWAQRENLVILDAGQSERFGCLASEFIDQHHAKTECYARVWNFFWKHVARIKGNAVEFPRGGLY